MSKLIFNPYLVSTQRQWYRLFTSGFIHADFLHLLVNMLVLFSFGPIVEQHFVLLSGESGSWLFLIYYLMGLPISILPTYFKQKENYLYNGLGASGSVSAVLFSFILFLPLEKIYLYGLIGIPGILAGIGYLWLSSYMDKKGGDNVNHNAHFWGAVYGFVFPITFAPGLFLNFLNQITSMI
jgi:membrane associated rhomboid family serine protease